MFTLTTYWHDVKPVHVATNDIVTAITAIIQAWGGRPVSSPEPKRHVAPAEPKRYSSAGDIRDLVSRAKRSSR